MRYLLDKLFAFILTVLTIITLGITICAFWQRLNGVHHPEFFNTSVGLIVSGSMEPNLPKGSVTIIRGQESYEAGDIITYIDKNDRSITHRIDEIKDGKIIPKGDANKYADRAITQDQIVGEVVFSFSAIYLILLFCGLQIIAVFALMWPLYDR